MMSQQLETLKVLNTRQFLIGLIRNLGPGLLLSVAGTLLIYELLRPHFPAESLIPLLVASLCPVLGNVVSLLRRRELDIFGLMVLLGILVSIIGTWLGGSPQLLLVRESFVTGAVGLVLLLSLFTPRPLGYYFARQFMAGSDPVKRAEFDGMWQYPPFRRSLGGGTIFWGLLLLGEFCLRLVLIFTLPLLFVLALAPIVFNIVIVCGIVVSAIWGQQLLRQVAEVSKEQSYK